MEIVANLLLEIALNSERKASLWGMYQPKEPKKILAKIKKNRKK